jgi:hypothetical protein
MPIGKQEIKRRNPKGCIKDAFLNNFHQVHSRSKDKKS